MDKSIVIVDCVHLNTLNKELIKSKFNTYLNVSISK